MMAGKARLFKDHRAAELIMSSPDPSAHKRISRGVRNFDSAAWDREKQHAVLSGKYARFTQNPAMKHHLLSTGNKRLAEASPPDSVWGNGLRADDHWRGKILLGEALSAVSEEIRDTETGLANPASAGWFRTTMGNAGIHDVSSCLLYTSPSPRDLSTSRMPSSA